MSSGVPFSSVVCAFDAWSTTVGFGDVEETWVIADCLPCDYSAPSGCASDVDKVGVPVVVDTHAVFNIGGELPGTASSEVTVVGIFAAVSDSEVPEWASDGGCVGAIAFAGDVEVSGGVPVDSPGDLVCCDESVVCGCCWVTVHDRLAAVCWAADAHLLAYAGLGLAIEDSCG